MGKKSTLVKMPSSASSRPSERRRTWRSKQLSARNSLKNPPRPCARLATRKISKISAVREKKFFFVILDNHFIKFKKSCGFVISVQCARRFLIARVHKCAGLELTAHESSKIKCV